MQPLVMSGCHRSTDLSNSDQTLVVDLGQGSKRGLLVTIPLNIELTNTEDLVDILLDEWIKNSEEPAQLSETSFLERKLDAVRTIGSQLFELYRSQDRIQLLDLRIACEKHYLALSEQLRLPTFLRLQALSCLLYLRLTKLGCYSDIEEAIKYGVQAARVGTHDTAQLAQCLAVLGVLWKTRFNRLGDMANIENAIQCLREAIETAPEGQLDKTGRLIDLGDSWHCRFQCSGELTDINHAIDCHSQAVELTNDDHSSKPGRVCNLGVLCLGRFRHFGQLEDIDRAIGYHSQAVQLARGAHPEKPGCLSGLGIALGCRFEHLGQPTDLDRAMDCLSQAVQLTQEGHPEKPGYLGNLGNLWRSRFELLGQISDIECAIEFHSQAVRLTRDGNPKKSGRLHNLGNSRLFRFLRIGQLADIDGAVACHSQAVQLALEGHPEYPMCLGSLGASLKHRFARFGDLADLEHALECLSQVVQLIPKNHPDIPGYLMNLGGAWMSRFERMGELPDLDNGLKYQSQAVQLTSDEHIAKPELLSSLGSSFIQRFQRFGELTDIDHALNLLSQSVRLTPNSHLRTPDRLITLGNAWLLRFERLGELADIDLAIESFNKAFQLIPDDHADKPRCLNCLGNARLRRFELLRNLPDIDHAIEHHSQASQLAADDDPDKEVYISSLGVSWLRRYQHAGEITDIDHAIECHSQAAGLIPDDHARKPTHLDHLGWSWGCRFQHTQNLADIDHSLEYLSKAIQLTPDGHREKPCRLLKLGASREFRYQCLRQQVDIEEACNAFRSAAQTTSFTHACQMQSAQKWAQLSRVLNLSPLEAYKVAFSSLTQLVWIGQTIKHRQSAMNMVRDLASQAASWAISVGSYDLALEWLEQGRAVIWSQTLQLRTSFDEISHEDPGLALELQDVARQLDIACSESTLHPSASDFSTESVSQTSHHHQLAFRWSELLTKARLLPGFHDFMLPLKAEELKRAINNGPVVVINAHDERCDALIIMPQRVDIIHVHLSKVTQEQLEALSTQTLSQMSQRGSAETARGFKTDTPNYIQSLVLLWTSVVEPILNALSYTDKLNDDELPHVTWCATGALSFLPLHAAGLYSDESKKTFDFVVSSYTPTISALLMHNKASASWAELLLVGQEATPGQTPLPNTARELRAINEQAIGTRYSQLDGASATVAATLTAMEHHSWVHFACHADQNCQNPSHSGFHLHDGTLTLEEIAKRQFKGKGLAFLSACRTATGDRNLPDEATHLAAGMLMVGYPSVIATMWSIVDEDAPVVAEVVYAELVKGGKMDHSQSARALHKAVARLRERMGEKEVWRWAPYIHIGV
ncbi:CHAT domain protein [Ceratobasidium sp. AG-Ba]|nr:CHAT domain protein [Ceratobasidium sp. AG-Ba]